jgi:oxygen-dependent protoporphyrinogen oxidase
VADAIVVGGGIAGLTCAVRLAGAGLDVVVFEEREEPGGNVRTIAEAGYRMERGPHAFLGTADDVFSLAEETGAGGDLVAARSASATRFIARHGRLHEVFTGPIGLLASGLLSARGKIDLLTEPLRTARGQEGDSAARFFERRFGPEAARVMAGAFVSGVYAGDPEALSAPAAFPLFWDFEQRWGGMIRGAVHHVIERRRARRALGAGAPPVRRGLHSLNGGLGTLSRAAAATLAGSLHLGAGVTSVGRTAHGWLVEAGGVSARARFLVVAVPPGEAARLLEPVDGGLASELGGVTLAPLAVVHMGFERRARRLDDAFGFLVPRGEGIRTLGVLFPSRMFTDRAPPGGDLLTGYAGGTTDPGALELSDRDLLATVLGDLESLTGHAREPDHVRVLRYRAAIPQLVHGHLDRMKRVREAVRGLPGLRLAGNYLRGVGLKDAVASGMEAGAWIVERRSNP